MKSRFFVFCSLVLCVGITSCSSTKELKDPIRDLMASRLEEMRGCYITYAKKTKNFKPLTANLSFRVEKDGKISTVALEGDKKFQRHAYISKCIAGILSKENLKDSLNGKVVDVNQPLFFTPRQKITRE